MKRGGGQNSDHGAHHTEVYFTDKMTECQENSVQTLVITHNFRTGAAVDKTTVGVVQYYSFRCGYGGIGRLRGFRCCHLSEGFFYNALMMQGGCLWAFNLFLD